jgi:hypothetical protein
MISIKLTDKNIVSPESRLYWFNVIVSEDPLTFEENKQHYLEFLSGGGPSLGVKFVQVFMNGTA